MPDHLSPEQRSANMGRIRGKDSSPEKRVRKMLHRMGFRFRLHRKDIPGNPDIVIPKYRTIVLVHGCYWHRHQDCRRGQSVPGTNTGFWLEKFRRNQNRDRLVSEKLAANGWNIVVVWECETKPSNLEHLKERLRREILEATLDLGEIR
jgi:DNA mismatch endonuclease (patch repair protein)